MAVPINLEQVASGYNLSKINSNFDKVAAAFATALGRTSTANNNMNTDLDMNSNDILNTNAIYTESLVVDGVPISGAGAGVISVVAGTGISVNSTDPANPIVTNTGLVSNGDKGDIVVSGSGDVWTIDTGVVSTAKMGGDVTTAGKALLDDANASAQRTTLGLVIGTNVQAQDTKLQNIVNLANSSGVLTNNGSGTLTWGSSGATIFSHEESTGNGTVGPYTLANTPGSTSGILVEVGGIVQTPSKYSISTNTVTFVEAIPSGTVWSIMYPTSATAAIAGDRLVSQYSGLGTGPYTLPTTPATFNAVTVIIGGVIQRKVTSVYNFTGTTLTLSASPGTDPVEIWVDASLSIGTPAAGTVGSTQLASAQAAAMRAVLGAFGVPRVQVFNASGTYTPNANMLYCIIECIGGGSGGSGIAGAGASSGSGSGGGGSGGYSLAIKSLAQIGVSQTVTIGAGGAGGTAGANVGSAGSDTSVGSLCVGKGAAVAPGTYTGGPGGVVGTGDITYPGISGINGMLVVGAAYGWGGNGGSLFGGNGIGALVVSGSTATAGGAATANTGSGGGGAGGNSTSSTAAGGNGASGKVVIWEFCSQ